MDRQEQACWLALFAAPGLDRAAAKRAVYRLTMVEQTPLSTCPHLAPEELREALPELDDAQAHLWASAMAGAASSAETLQELAGNGIRMLTRADGLYPENLALRLGETWLPYILFYRGNLELLGRPCVYVAGTEDTGRARDTVRSLVAQLGDLELCFCGGYTQGIDREMVTAIAARGGNTMLTLPLGFSQAGPILRAGQSAVDRGQRLELSPYLPETIYSPALGLARTRLATALADVLLLIDPECPADDWPGLTELTAHGGLALVQQHGQRVTVAGDTPGWAAYSGAEDARNRIVLHLNLNDEMPEVGALAAGTPLAEIESAEQPTAYEFANADAAIDILGRSGHVPASLERRLREAERTGNLGAYETEGNPHDSTTEDQE